MASWQYHLASNSSRLSHMWKTGAMSDVTFIVGLPPRQRRFKVHKTILSMCSDIFFNLFYHEQPHIEEVTAYDIDPDIFEIVMRYVYEESFSVTSVVQATKTFFLANKCNMDHLRNLCIRYLTNHLNTENIWTFYRNPCLLESLQIKEKCQNTLAEKCSVLLRSRNLAYYPVEMMKDMLMRDDLDVASEKELFEYLLQWAKAVSDGNATANPKGELFTLLKELLPHIRFLAMKVEEFLSGPAKSGILTDSEIASISENIISPECRALPSWCSKLTTRKAMRFFQLVDGHVCTYEGIFVDSASLEINITQGTVALRGASIYFSSDSQLDVQSVEFTIECYQKKISAKVHFSWDAEKGLIKCLLLQPFVMNHLATYKIYILSSKSIFPLCSQVKSVSFTRKVPTASFNFTLKRRVAGGSAFYDGCSHFYQIFYN